MGSEGLDRGRIYTVLKDCLASLKISNASIKIPPRERDESILMTDLNLDQVSFSELKDELEARFEGRSLGLEDFFSPEEFHTLTIGALISRIQQKLFSRPTEPLVVYVDDEEENLFIFKRRFGKDLNLVSFNEPLKALEFIRSSPNVALVITDEVMPNLRGNMLCDRVKEVKPFMKFILITGNPENDDNLMHKSLRANRFYEFIRKPIDFEAKGEELLAMIQGLVAFEW